MAFKSRGAGPQFRQDLENYTKTLEDRLAALEAKVPDVTSADNGKVLKVVAGEWALGDDDTGA